MKSKSIWLLGFLIVAAPLLIAGGWADICTNLLGIRLDPVTVPHATNGQVIAYRSVDNTYVATSAGSGGGGGVTTFVPGAGISGAIVGTTLGVSNTGVLSVTAGTNVTFSGTASAPVINASVSGSGVNGTVNGAGSTALTTVNVTGTLLGAKGSISGSTLNVSLDQIVNADIATGAAVAYAKLALTGQIVNGDISASAAVAYSKLALTGSIVNADVSNSAAIAYSKLALTTSIVNGDVSASAAIAYSKLALTGSIVNADIGSSAAIVYSKLSLMGGILNADINASAAIAYSKLALSNSILVADIASAAKTGTGTKVVTDAGASIGTPNFVFGSDAANDIAIRGASTYGRAALSSLFTAGTAVSITGTNPLTINNTGVTSAVAGTGIGVSAGTGAVTISNSGVTSNVAGTGITVSAATGAVTIGNGGVTSAVAGTGITVSGATGAVTIGNGGVTSIVAGTGVTISGATGAVTVNAFGPAKFRIAMMPGAAEITGATSDPLLIGTKGTNSSWSYLAYNDTTVMDGRWVNGGSIVNDYAGGAITLRIRWYATATTGNVVWTVKTLARAAGSVMDTAYDATNAHTVTTAAAGTTLQLVNSDITWTPIAGELTAGSIFMVQAERTASSGSDTMTGDANVVSVTATEN